MSLIEVTNNFYPFCWIINVESCNRQHGEEEEQEEQPEAGGCRAPS